MPIIHPEGPADGLGELSRVLSDFFGNPDLVSSTALKALDPHNLAAANPHHRYTVGMRRLADGHFLDAAEAHGWRYLLLEGDRAVGEFTLSEESVEGKLDFQSLTTGKIPAGCLTAHYVAEGLPKVAKGDWELSLIEAPALPFCALWLRDRSAPDDLFVPVTPVNLGLDARRGYSAAELQPVLQKAAKQTVGLHEKTFTRLGPIPPQHKDVDQDQSAS